MNERIRVPQVRLIGADNQQIGIISTLEAINMARETGIDLVEVSPTSDPPVCRLMDYGKWKYEQKKKDHKAKLKQHNVVLKEVRLRPKIDTHDKDFKLKQARSFLEKGSKVQFTMLFRGREMIHLDRAIEVFQEIAREMEELAKVETSPRRQGRRMTMVLAPTGVPVKHVAPPQSKPTTPLIEKQEDIESPERAL